MNQGRTVTKLEVATAIGMITVFLEDPTFESKGDKIIVTQALVFQKPPKSATPKTQPHPPV